MYLNIGSTHYCCCYFFLLLLLILPAPSPLLSNDSRGRCSFSSACQPFLYLLYQYYYVFPTTIINAITTFTIITAPFVMTGNDSRGRRNFASARQRFLDSV